MSVKGTQVQQNDAELQGLVNEFQTVVDYQCSVVESNVGFGLRGHLNGDQYRNSQSEHDRILSAIAGKLNCSVLEVIQPVRLFERLEGRVSAESLDKLSDTTERYLRSEGLKSILGGLLAVRVAVTANKITKHRAAVAERRFKL